MSTRWPIWSAPGKFWRQDCHEAILRTGHDIPYAPCRPLHKGGLGPLFYTGLDEQLKNVFRERLKARFAFVDQHLSTRAYLLDKDYSMVDVGLYAMMGWTSRVGFDMRTYPNLVAHHARIADRDAVREAHRVEGSGPA